MITDERKSNRKYENLSHMIRQVLWSPLGGGLAPEFGSCVETDSVTHAPRKCGKKLLPPAWASLGRARHVSCRSEMT